jgi:hypothetical protein
MLYFFPVINQRQVLLYKTKSMHRLIRSLKNKDAHTTKKQLIFKPQIPYKKFTRQGAMAHLCNLSYSRGREGKDCSLRHNIDLMSKTSWAW